MRRAVIYAKENELNPCFIGDVFFYGKNPVETLMLALDEGAKIVIGYKTNTLFGAMHGSKASSEILQTFPRSKKTTDALRRFEGHLIQLYDKGKAFLIDEDETLYCASGCPPGLRFDASATIKVAELYVDNATSIKRIQNNHKPSGFRRIVSSIRHRQQRFKETSESGEDVFYLNTGASTKIITLDARKNKTILFK